MAARKNRGTTSLPEEWKEKIKAYQLINRLAQCGNGEIEMSNSQIKAADIVLKKIIPDLARTELGGTVNIQPTLNVFPSGNKPTSS